MKKVLIGCGVIVLLLIGGFSFIYYQLKDEIAANQEKSVAGAIELAELEAQYPFDASAEAPFDPERFGAMLDARIAAGEVQRARDEAFRAETEGGELGFFDIIRAKLDTEPSLADIAGALADSRMGPTEFAHHTKIMWAALERVGAGLGPAELEPLRGTYASFAETYETMSMFPQFAPLEEVLGEVDRAVTDAAMEEMVGRAEQLDRLGVRPDIEPLYLNIGIMIEAGEAQREQAGQAGASDASDGG